MNTSLLIDLDDDITDINEKQCMICLQGSTMESKDEIKLMNEMHFLIKKCNCECYSHHKCIETWIQNNAVCPICKKGLSFPHVNVNKNEIINIPLDNGTYIQQPIQSICYTNFLRIICLIFIICIVLTILKNRIII